ncbi:hypothetical protein Fot_22033 [Forsythia ovata]|uniref:Uncharacterized protein n=1 Tax=Forsythia ovata TaxID=205694 RepID=A0ABD1UWV0_9LAMI
MISENDDSQNHSEDLSIELKIMDEAQSSLDHDKEVEMRPTIAYFIIASTSEVKRETAEGEDKGKGWAAGQEKSHTIVPSTIKPSLDQRNTPATCQLDEELITSAYSVTIIQSRFMKVDLKMLRLGYDVTESVQLRIFFAYEMSETR